MAGLIEMVSGMHKSILLRLRWALHSLLLLFGATHHGDLFCYAKGA